MNDALTYAAHDGWAALTLNRPERRNALNTALLAALADQLDAAAASSATRCVLLSGVDGNFAAGADLSEIEAKTRQDAASDPRKALWDRIRSFPKPLVAAVDGYCLGGGFELALMSDVIVAGPTARFGLTETNLGFIPGAGGAHRLTTLIGRARATRMILTGEIIDAATAERWGVCAYLSEGEALAAAAPLAERMSRRAPLALEAAKAAVVDADEGPHAAGMARARSAFEGLMDSADKAEGIAAFKQKRQPEYRGL